ncbi:S26 family signal peptidase [Bradyrhizobium sp. STM 3809]|uniref:S26 family signal peptidase n=1 Tax=Bradyrhizobium sp. STM 3809 TaxID=551936 RepID=UPI0002409C81|nr:S26 family signal peptidase [Bradyrhizobium sp. STM 3809]CCD98047.1 TraF peptidase. Serine peptidase. MEROPS family S26C precursor [Bradyrhizobium sp. STM 3809]
MRRRFSIAVAMFSGVTLLLGAGAANPRPHFIWNASESVPIGLYAVQPVSDWYVTELVVVRPQEQLAAFLAAGGYLPVGAPMLKRILALPGQTVCRRELAIIVDDVEVGAAQQTDRRGHPLPDWQGCRIVADGQIFLMNWQSEVSLDGRYFGLTAMSDVIGRAVPMWTREP